jgi:hypothetical protein
MSEKTTYRTPEEVTEEIMQEYCCTDNYRGRFANLIRQDRLALCRRIDEAGDNDARVAELDLIMDELNKGTEG